MDALRDIEGHPAFAIVENEGIIRKRLKVIDLINSIKCHIAKYGLTERTNPDSNGFSHYKECYENYTKGGDVVDTCKCCWVGFYRYQALQMLDEIDSMSHH